MRSIPRAYRPAALLATVAGCAGEPIERGRFASPGTPTPLTSGVSVEK